MPGYIITNAEVFDNEAMRVRKARMRLKNRANFIRGGAAEILRETGSHTVLSSKI